MYFLCFRNMVISLEQRKMKFNLKSNLTCDIYTIMTNANFLPSGLFGGAAMSGETVSSEHRLGKVDSLTLSLPRSES